ncbi:sporulation protein YlmC with PRC-barrel domain [Rhizomicrobium palustre]|uniref:Sporulation protein YlmC with PRC-barrel domain n=1 Tax=Rhizomicrobium palustre TaxID=189966 RepID=A0A846N175_9PROT|nr:PRC-barrel domain-containing protein [Rhizomicrobium palustre]NIK89215.1 sporulation protein YlmC with PRC-barrel domain [Rhizomicrobium palustre]
MPTRSGHTTAILGSKVVGTPVYDSGGEKVGHIQDLMLDKLSDRLVFAVIGIGFSPGIGQRCCPVPWTVLDFDPAKQGYVLALSAQQFRHAPSFGHDELTEDDGARARELTDHFYNAI